MQAYKRTDLYNKYVCEQAAEAFENTCISSESYKKILQSYPYKLYTPNYFIRIALGLLTVVAVVCMGLLLWLVTGISGSNGLAALCIFFALCCYTALELFVKAKQFYNAGVDNILMISVIVFIVCAVIASDFESSVLFISSIIMISCLWISLRFIDAFAAVVSYCAFFVFVFLCYLKLGNIAKATAPLLMMTISAVVYLFIKKLIDRQRFIYQFCLKSVSLLTLLTFYASGNYFVVKELGNEMFHLASHEALPLEWLFWIFTIAIPPAYIMYGIKKKDFLFVRTGIGLMAAAIFTVRYYHAVLSGPMVMLISGAVLLVVSYALIKYLSTPKHGFSFAKTKKGKDALNVEALIIAQTFGEQRPAPESNPIFGGGSGGGGGATGEY